MQLFGLINTLLTNDRVTAERDLSIARYAVIPLSPNRCATPPMCLAHLNAKPSPLRRLLTANPSPLTTAA